MHIITYFPKSMQNLSKKLKKGLKNADLVAHLVVTYGLLCELEKYNKYGLNLTSLDSITKNDVYDTIFGLGCAENLMQKGEWSDIGPFLKATIEDLVYKKFPKFEKINLDEKGERWCKKYVDFLVNELGALSYKSNSTFFENAKKTNSVFVEEYLKKINENKDYNSFYLLKEIVECAIQHKVQR